MKSRLDTKTITKLTVLEDGKSEEFYWDREIDRFGLRLRRGAGDRVLRSWIIQYRQAGATRRMTIGSADVFSPEQARTAARKVLAKVDLGEDPQGDRSDRREKDKLSFRSVVAEYIEAKRDDIRPTTLRHITGYLARGPYFKPLHGMPIDRITRRDVAAQLVSIARENGKPTADQARRKISAFFSWAMKMGLVEHNPVIGTVQQKPSPPRDRVLSNPELTAIWNACDGSDDFSRIVRLLILLPCRRQEVGGMAWSELDLDAAAWTLPASRSKNHRAITLPLMPMALDIICSVPRRLERDQLFGSHHEKGFSPWDRGKKSLDKKAGLTTPWNIHDIRRSIATRLADLGVAPHVIEQILNHQSGHKAGVAGIYNRSSYEREVRSALALWADHVNALVTGSARKVVALHPK
jgi:integrase